MQESLEAQNRGLFKHAMYLHLVSAFLRTMETLRWVQQVKKDTNNLSIFWARTPNFTKEAEGEKTALCLRAVLNV